MGYRKMTNQGSNSKLPYVAGHLAAHVVALESQPGGKQYFPGLVNPMIHQLSIVK